ncbi:MAG: ABC transporter ATP-binding protein [Candidatus Berkiella sp.]
MIKVTNLTKRFNGFVAVDNISFFVPEGKIFAFLGPNGAGKTTTVKMLTTLLSPTSGTLTVNGFELGTDPMQVRRSFGIVFQDLSLDEELTAYENMEFHGVLYNVPANERKTRIKELLELVELFDRRNEYVKQYSGGMKRRLEIARALLHHPKIIFLDEPTIGLDPQTRNHIWGYLQHLTQQQKITVFFTTHYMEEAERVADEIAIIDQGKIVAQGTASALKELTQKTSLEEAFIALTGHVIREESGTSMDSMRIRRRLWKR